jgi:hypothetical protein
MNSEIIRRLEESFQIGDIVQGVREQMTEQFHEFLVKTQNEVLAAMRDPERARELLSKRED